MHRSLRAASLKNLNRSKRGSYESARSVVVRSGGSHAARRLQLDNDPATAERIGERRDAAADRGEGKRPGQLGRRVSRQRQLFASERLALAVRAEFDVVLC